MATGRRLYAKQTVDSLSGCVKRATLIEVKVANPPH
jgi:hypothetical protein